MATKLLLENWSVEDAAAESHVPGSCFRSAADSFGGEQPTKTAAVKQWPQIAMRGSRESSLWCASVNTGTSVAMFWRVTLAPQSRGGLTFPKCWVDCHGGLAVARGKSNLAGGCHRVGFDPC